MTDPSCDYVERYLERLEQLKAGHRALLRALACAKLHRDVRAFDLFTGLWWPLRQQSPRAPERESAWLIAKLFAAFPFEHEREESLPRVLGLIARRDPTEASRLTTRFDHLLASSRANLEAHLRWALALARRHEVQRIDWVQLINDFWQWDRDPKVKEAWASAFLNPTRKASPSPKSIPENSHLIHFESKEEKES